MFKYLIFSFLFAAVLAGPHALRKDNPDERGDYYQGDIRLARPLSEMTKNGLIDERYRWPNGVVPYVINGAFSASQLQVIQDAFAEYDSKTGGCITFQERTTESNYVSIVNYDPGCWSYVGMIGGEQEINYPDWCIDQWGSVLHEMLHALGFFHEQSSTNRDDYVTIVWDNIEAGYESNFDKYDDSYISAFGYDYDYGSVMHYSAYAFSDNGEMTIVTLDPDYQDVIGQREGFSTIDVGKLMAMYNC